MELKTQRHGAGAVITVHGSVSASDAVRIFALEARNVVESGVTSLLIDLSNTVSINSRFIGKLVELYHLCRRSNGVVMLYCGSNAYNEELFRITQIDKLLKILTSMDGFLTNGGAQACLLDAGRHSQDARPDSAQGKG